MKIFKIVIALIMLVTVSACSSATSSTFVITSDAKDVVETADESANYKTGMSLQDALSFYKTEYTAKGLTERTLNTVESETTFSIVFDGSENGKAVVVQGVKLDESTVNINVRYEAI